MNNKESTYLSLDIKTAKKNGLPCQVGISPDFGDASPCSRAS